MLSLFSGTENERLRLMRASQSLHDYLQGCISATRTLLCVLNQHLNTSVTLEPVGGGVSIGESLERLLRAVREMHAAAEQTDRHVRKVARQDLYTRMASPETSLQEKGAIIQDFYQDTMGIFVSVGGPVVAMLLQNAGLPEQLEAALREAEASPVLCLPMDALRQSSEKLVMALSPCPADRGPAGETAAGSEREELPRTAVSPAGPRPAEGAKNSPFPGTGVAERLWGCLPDVITGRCTRIALVAATGHLEEACQALASACKSFQLAAATAEVYMALIAEQQLGTGGVAH
ncbi:uncharacterized protein C12orf60-like [Emydura macquarii macquarii]|uniref:uncharacterized protein C12orf60-like n=1 Tax=Emydura macquarii macquarii TaxID=1129001 RepID=UPI00352B0BE5